MNNMCLVLTDEYSQVLFCAYLHLVLLKNMNAFTRVKY
jgi:hypothetical protein